MGLIRICCPPDQSFSEYYSRLPNDDGFLLNALKRLDEAVGDLPVYALNDRASLALLSQPDQRGVAWVKIIPEAPLAEVTLWGTAPDRFMPFPEAQVMTISESIEDAVDKIIKLMEYSEGWTPEKKGMMTRELWKPTSGYALPYDDLGKDLPE